LMANNLVALFRKLHPSPDMISNWREQTVVEEGYLLKAAPRTPSRTTA
jgi:hypothetical protein